MQASARLLGLCVLGPLAALPLVVGACSHGSESSAAPAAATAGSAVVGAPERRLTAAQAQAAVASAMTEYERGHGADCAKVIVGLVSGLPEDVSPASEPAFDALADCAERQKDWSLLKLVTVRLTREDKAFAHPSMLPAAEIGMGEYTRAETALANLLPRYPTDPDLVFDKGVIPCKQMQWLPCVQGMDEAIKLIHDAAFEGKADLRRADAFVHTGQLDQAQTAVDKADKLGASKEDVARRRKALALARTAKVAIDAFHQSEIPLGVYHLYGKARDAGVPAQMWIDDVGPKDRQLRVEAEIVGVTGLFSNTVTVLKGMSEIVPIVPALQAGFNVAAQTGQTTATLHMKVTAIDPAPAGADGTSAAPPQRGPHESVIYDVSDPVTVLPHDALMLSAKVDLEAVRTLDDYVGAWVTPNAKAVAAFVQVATRRAPGAAFAGNQAASLPQVQAVYDELQQRGASFAMDAEAATDTGVPHKTRLPADVLSTNGGNGVEGAILFASILEAIGLDPAIIRIPGHAFVGWHSVKDAMPDGTRLYVETTMVHTASFASARQFARAEFDSQTRQHHFEQGIAKIIEIRTLRGRGITPQPFE